MSVLLNTLLINPSKGCQIRIVAFLNKSDSSKKNKNIREYPSILMRIKQEKDHQVQLSLNPKQKNPKT